MWVHQSDLASLPYPVALPLSRTRRALSRDVPDKALLALLATVEEMLRFTNATVLSAALKDGYQPDHVVVDLMRKKRSLGDRGQLLIRLTEKYGRGAPTLNMGAFADQKCCNELSRSLGSITKLRNRLIHEPPRSSEANRDPLAVMLESAAALDPIITWLLGTRLVSVFQTPSPGSPSATVLPWMGQVPGIDDESLALTPDMSDGSSLRPGQVLICVNRVNVLLSPFLVVRDDPARDQAEMHMIERFVTRPDGAIGADWVNLTSSDRPTPTGAVEELELAKVMLTAWLPSSPAQPKRALDMERFLFGTTPLLIDRLLSQYVDRSDVPAAIESLMNSHSSGSLWLIAGPGAGKSSVLAAIVQRYQAVHHFVSQSEGRNNQTAILRSLIAQVLTHMDADELPEADDDLLPQQLANLLVRQALKSGTSDPLVLALDAIDELGDEEAISRFLRTLPQELPSGAYVVISSRPLPPSIAVPAGAKKFELKPLSIGDIRHVALKHNLPADPKSCEAAFVASRGNPLFAVWALTLLRDQPGLPLSVGDGFEDIISPILAGPMMSDRGDDLAHVLAVLGAAQKPLDLSSLSTATGLRRARTRAAIDCVSAVLSMSGGEVTLGHQVVRDYLFDPRSIYGLDASDVLSAHRSLARLAESDLAAYPSSLSPWHAVRAGDPGLIRELLKRGNCEASLSGSIVELATTDIESAKKAVDWLPPDSYSIALDVVARLCDMRMPVAARSLLSLEWADGIGDIDRTVIEMNLAVATEDIRRAIELARTVYPKLTSSDVAPALVSKAAFLFGDGLRIEGHHEEALSLYTKALAKASSGSSEEFRASFQIADIDYVCGRLRKAEARLNELLSTARSHGNVFGEVQVLRELGHLPLARDEARRAVQLYSDALDLALVTGRKGMLAECYVSLAESLATVDPQLAIQTASVGAEHAVQANAPREAGKSFYVQAEANLHLKAVRKSLEAALTSLRMLTESNYGSGTARAHLAAAKALFELGRLDEALEHASNSHMYYERERIYPQHWADALLLLRQVYAELGKTNELADLATIAELPNIGEYPQFAPSRRHGAGLS
jgi:tetratricopeptide (TPR) repeat protein